METDTPTAEDIQLLKKTVESEASQVELCQPIPTMSAAVWSDDPLTPPPTGPEGAEEGEDPDEEEVRAAAGCLHHQSPGGPQEGRGVPDSQSGGSLTRGGRPCRAPPLTRHVPDEPAKWKQTLRSTTKETTFSPLTPGGR